MVLGLASTSLLVGQTSAPAPAAASTVSASAAATLNEAQLKELLGPIALYPDALIALILPASTEPSHIVMAARYLASKPPADTIESQPWPESVKGLARYPDVIEWMDANLEWTDQLGDAFVAQPADVMNAMQGLREQARTLGTLTDTPEQKVVVEERIIRIEPAQPEVIYVPRYDPTVVFVSRPLGLRSSYLSFSYGYPTGVWLSYACDWRYRSVVVVAPHYRGTYHASRPTRVIHQHNYYSSGNFHRWTPPVNRVRPQINRPRRAEVVRPAPIQGAPVRPGSIGRPQQQTRPGFTRVEQRPTGIGRPNNFDRPGPGGPSGRERRPSASPAPRPTPRTVSPAVPSAPTAPRAPVISERPMNRPRPAVPDNINRPQSPRPLPPSRIQQGPPNRVITPQRPAQVRPFQQHPPSMNSRIGPTVPDASSQGQQRSRAGSDGGRRSR